MIEGSQLAPEVLAHVDQLDADTVALIRVSVAGCIEVRKVRIPLDHLASILRELADRLDVGAPDGI